MKKELIRAAVDAVDCGHPSDRRPHCGPGPICPDKVVYVVFTKKLLICTGTCDPHSWPVGHECDEEWREHECHKKRKGHGKHERHGDHEHEQHEHDECRHQRHYEPHDDCCEPHEDWRKQHRGHCEPRHWEHDGDCCTRERRSWLEPVHRPRRTIFHFSS